MTEYVSVLHNSPNGQTDALAAFHEAIGGEDNCLLEKTFGNDVGYGVAFDESSTLVIAPATEEGRPAEATFDRGYVDKKKAAYQRLCGLCTVQNCPALIAIAQSRQEIFPAIVIRTPESKGKVAEV